MPEAPEPFASRIDAKSKILQDEFYDHLAEVQIEMPEVDQRVAFEGWAIQKIAALWVIVEELKADLAAKR